MKARATSLRGPINIQVLSSVTERIDKLFSAVPAVSSKCSIYRVPERLRSVKHEAYTPMIVSIGPLHQGNDKLQIMEDQKVRNLRFLVNQDPRKLEDLIKVLIGWEDQARGCYEEILTSPSEEFVTMMLLDGCFLVELFRQNKNSHSAVENEEHPLFPIFSNYWMINAVHRDLLLLENQLPFFILVKLFKVINDFSQTKVINDFSHSDVISDYFLALTESFLGTYGSMRFALPLGFHGGEHLVHLLLNNISYPLNVAVLARRGVDDLVFIPSATELHETGVKFKKGDIQNLLNIKFIDGVLEIPPLRVDERTEALFRNLIAMEQSHCGKDLIGESNSSTILSDYLTLMDCLVNTPNDIALLRDQQIIHNWLGDNKEVAQLFNKLRNGVVTSSNGFHYYQLFKDVNAYYSTRWPKWKTKLRRDYFNTPWAILSFVAAVVLLVATFIQTGCGIIQVKQQAR